MIDLLIIAVYGGVGAYMGIKATEKMFPINRPDRIESGCIILTCMVTWPLFLLVWCLGFLFDKTTDY